MISLLVSQEAFWEKQTNKQTTTKTFFLANYYTALIFILVTIFNVMPTTVRFLTVSLYQLKNTRTYSERVLLDVMSVGNRHWTPLGDKFHRQYLPSCCHLSQPPCLFRPSGKARRQQQWEPPAAPPASGQSAPLQPVPLSLTLGQFGLPAPVLPASLPAHLLPAVE